MQGLLCDTNNSGCSAGLACASWLGGAGRAVCVAYRLKKSSVGCHSTISSYTSCTTCGSSQAGRVSERHIVEGQPSPTATQRSC